MQAARRAAERAVGRLVFAAVGEVVEVDRANQRVRCRMSVSGHKTNWCRVGRAVAESDAGDVADVGQGSEVLLVFPSGNPAEPGVAVAGLYGKNRAPSVAAGERALVHSSGTEVRISQSGAVEVSGASSVKVEGAGQVEVDGTQVKLGGGASSAVKFEELDAALSSVNPTTWVGAVTLAFQALGVTLPPMTLTTARATKVRVQ